MCFSPKIFRIKASSVIHVLDGSDSATIFCYVHEVVPFLREFPIVTFEVKLPLNIEKNIALLSLALVESYSDATSALFPLMP